MGCPMVFTMRYTMRDTPWCPMGYTIGGLQIRLIDHNHSSTFPCMPLRTIPKP